MARIDVSFKAAMAVGQNGNGEWEFKWFPAGHGMGGYPIGYFSSAGGVKSFRNNQNVDNEMQIGDE